MLTDRGAPTATGLAPNGRRMTAVTSRPSFYGSPLVTWEPASGAVGYQVEWSRSKYPWRPAGALKTPATSTMLPLKSGHVVVSRARRQRLAARQATVHDLVEPGLHRHHEADI